MFSNIGSKIKILAQITTWIGIIGALIGGIAVITIGDEFIIIGLLIIILGALLSWISSYILYGFGQLVENSDLLIQKNSPMPTQSNPKTTSVPKKVRKNTTIGNCEICGKENVLVSRHFIDYETGSRTMCEKCEEETI